MALRNYANRLHLHCDFNHVALHHQMGAKQTTGVASEFDNTCAPPDDAKGAFPERLGVFVGSEDHDYNMSQSTVTVTIWQIVELADATLELRRRFVFKPQPYLSFSPRLLRSGPKQTPIPEF